MFLFIIFLMIAALLTTITYRIIYIENLQVRVFFNNSLGSERPIYQNLVCRPPSKKEGQEFSGSSQENKNTLRQHRVTAIIFECQR